MADWNPDAYAAFRGLRLRPALDLLSRVPTLPPGGVVDLGCGDGAVGPALAVRFPDRFLTGVDASPAMLARAAATGAYGATIGADAGAWTPGEPPALVFSNAALHWLPDHGALFPRLAAGLAPGGVLAVQMPRQFDAPSHALIRDLAQRLFPDRFDFAAWRAPVHPPQAYHAILAPLGDVDIWETAYLQTLAPVAEGHPVRAFTAATAMRPVTDRLSDGEAAALTAAYDDALRDPYPGLPDGSVLFPFRRLFLTLKVP